MRTLSCFALACGAVVCASSLACSSSGDSSSSEDLSGYYPGGGGYGGGGGGATGAGGQSNPQQAGADAGEPPDAGVSCEALDPSGPEVLYLSADDSNSMASPAIARRLIQGGAAVPPGIIRTYEFLNYYNVPFEPADPGTLRIVPQLRRASADTDIELMIGVQSPSPASPRRPMTITFVLDTSGSMDGSPISLEKSVVKAVASTMQAGDIVNAVTWNSYNAVVMSGRQVAGPNDPEVLQMADKLSANGSTDLHGGLVSGYELAQQHFGAGRINRVVLISDGQANVGVTDENLIGEEANDENKEGIYLVGVGVGDGVNDTLMNVVTDAGNGAYVYIDSAPEAQRMFHDRFDETMEVAARAVQVKLTVPWYFQMYKFHGEQYSGDPSKVKPQHLAPGDAMVFHQILRACDASRVATTDTLEFAATWTDPLDYSQRSASTSSTLGDLLEASDRELRRTRAIVAYAEVLKTLANTPLDKRAELLDGALATVQQADEGTSDWAIGEILTLLQQCRAAVQ